MTQHLRLFLLSIFFLGNFGSCNGQATGLLTEEQQFQKKMDDWMKPYRREQVLEFEQWIDWVENHIDDVWRHPVYKHLERFNRLHQEAYLRLRKADLARYPSAPDTLPGYERVSDFYAPYEDKGYPLADVLRFAQRIGNFRTLGAADMRFVIEILSGYVSQYLKAEKRLTLQQVMKKRMYGELLFADPVAADRWKITVVNRLYTLIFDWRITDNQISEPILWVYTGKNKLPGWLKGQFPKCQTPVQQLDSTLSSFRWSLYDEEDSEVVDSKGMLSSMRNKLTAFYQAHHTDYIRLRSEELAKYPPPDTAYGNAYKHMNGDLQQDLLSVLEKDGGRYKISKMVAPYETEGSYTIHNFRYILMLRMKNYAEYNLTAWIAGVDTYSKRISKNLWELQFFYNDYGVRFRWNIATDEITDLTVKSKVDINVDRPVGEPTEI